jgi:adenosylmethionine-8-amino-7-oxononanoate aminotransferase
MSHYADKDAAYIWHPYTQHQTESVPPVITSAKGASLFDENGTEILDMISSWWTCVHGHSHPAINKALSDQAAKVEHVMFAGFTHPAGADLAEKLVNALPGDLSKVFFSDNGSTAVEVALKIAYQYWKNKGENSRTLFLAFDGAYHGDTVGAMAVGKGCGFFKTYSDLLFTVQTLPFVETWNDDADIDAKEEAALEAIQQTIAANNNKIAALIVEPIMQGASGIRFCRPSYIKKVSDIARANGILVIFDEVAVGFGRLGTLFACEQVGFAPDLICLSKGLSAGYLPLSVTVATQTLFNAFLDQGAGKMLMHGHTFTANPLACAVALRSLELFDEEKTLAKIAHIEKRHGEFLATLKGHPLVEKARVHGSVMAFNLPEQSGYKSSAGEYLREFFMERGLNIRPIGSSVYLLPPYCVTDDELSRAYDGILNGLTALRLQEAA